MKTIPIGIAIVLSHECVLVGQREQVTHLAGYAEFPGGKCEIGESAAECAIRECFEETGLRVEVVETLHHDVHQYPDRAVDLSFFLCRLVESIEQHPDASPFAWIQLDELSEQNFPAGNHAVLQILADRY